MPAVMWFRRDLRLSDNPALLDAAAPRRRRAAALRRRPGAVGAERTLPAALPHRVAARPRRAHRPGGPHRRPGHRGGPRRARGRGRPASTSPPTSAPTAAPATRRSTRPWPSTTSSWSAPARSYAVAPGRVTKGDGTPYQVYTPFYRAWTEHGWRDPAGDLGPVSWLAADSDGVPDEKLPDGLELPAAGEEAAKRRWRDYRREHLEAYDRERDRPDLDTTSHMSVHLKWGEIHPRTMLADLKGMTGQGRADLPQGAGLAGVLRRRAVPPAGVRAGLLQARSSPGWTTTCPATSSRPGGRAGPASRSWTPACASCARPAGCTTGSG